MKTCDTCMHKNLCKYENQFKKFIEEKNYDIELDSPFNVEFICKYYREKLPNLNLDPGITYRNLNYCKPSSCEGCTFYEQYIKGNKTYIGDSPCDFCIKSPTRVTCESNLSATSKTSEVLTDGQ